MAKRVSAEVAMNHTYFDSLGPAVKLLPDSKLSADVGRFSLLFTLSCRLRLLLFPDESGSAGSDENLLWLVKWDFYGPCMFSMT